MWGNDDNARGFMFPPVFHDPKTYEIEKPYTNGPMAAQHHFRGRRGTRGNYQNSNCRQQKNNVANKQFYCDTCDRAFDSADLLDEHFAEHKTCGWDGCTFQAHYKIVELHIKMQHETGFADKIMLLNDPKEIEKWKSERRRNYPTAKNVARRQAEQAEKTERGEVIPSKEFGKFQRNGNKQFECNGKNRGQGRQRMNNGSDRPMDQYASKRGGRWQRKRRRPGNNRAAAAAEYVVPTVTDDFFGWNEDSGIKRFAGIGTTNPYVKDSASRQDMAFRGENGDPITDSEDENAISTVEAPSAHPKVHIPQALENLLASYPSESEEETCTRPETIPKQPRVENQPKPTNKPHRQPQNRSSLLEKLLAKEIQHERNKIFQCVRYIVQKEFFGVH